MSFHHANITWQSPDGTWSCGFFERIPANTMGEDYDAEWDDDFDTNRFQFVSTGHPDEDSPCDAWGGPNPGSTTTIPCGDSTAEEIEQYEDMAARNMRNHHRAHANQASLDWAETPSAISDRLSLGP